MRDIATVFPERAKRAWVGGIQLFAQIMRNQGILVALFGLLAASAFGYQGLLKALSPAFPVALLIALLMAVVLTKANVRTFVKEADLVFLLPAEPRLAGYFRKSLRYSALFQAVHVVLLIVALLPLFQARLADKNIWIVLLLAIAVKEWNLLLYWQEVLLARRQPVLPWLRFLANALLMYALLTNMWLALAGGLVLLLVITVVVTKNQRAQGYPWTRLLALEQKTLSSYYSWANFFVDVPQIKNRVKKRAWVFALLRSLPAGRRNPYLFLYTRTFFRYSEYFGIYLRLMVLFGVILLFIKYAWLSLGIYVLALFLMAFQLPMFWSERRYSELLQIYPLTHKQKEQGIARFGFGLLCAESVLLSLLLLFSPLKLTLVGGFLLIGLLFSYLISFFSLPKRTREMEIEREAEREKAQKTPEP